CLLGFAVRFFHAREGGEIKSLGLDLRPIDHHGGTFPDQHFVNGPTGQMDRGGLAAQGSPAAAKVEAAAGRNRQDLGNAGSAGNGKVLARGGNRGSGDNVRVVVSRFGGVHGGADRSDFAEAYLRDRIEEPGINFESFGINDPGAGGDFDSRANRDRKSTRLNSSHVAISYAVFCLKKKTTNER